MNYIGSKKSLLDFLEKSIDEVVDKDCHVFCDLFAGTGAVGTHFKKKGYKVIANDIQYYSFVLNKHYIGNHKELFFEKLVKEIPELKKGGTEERKLFVCNHLSNLKTVKGFIYKNYCLGGTKQKNTKTIFFRCEWHAMRCCEAKN